MKNNHRDIKFFTSIICGLILMTLISSFINIDYVSALNNISYNDDINLNISSTGSNGIANIIENENGIFIAWKTIPFPITGEPITLAYSNDGGQIFKTKIVNENHHCFNLKMLQQNDNFYFGSMTGGHYPHYYEHKLLYLTTSQGLVNFSRPIEVTGNTSLSSIYCSYEMIENEDTIFFIWQGFYQKFGANYTTMFIRTFDTVTNTFSDINQVDYINVNFFAQSTGPKGNKKVILTSIVNNTYSIYEIYRNGTLQFLVDTEVHSIPVNYFAVEDFTDYYVYRNNHTCLDIIFYNFTTNKFSKFLINYTNSDIYIKEIFISPDKTDLYCYGEITGTISGNTMYVISKYHRHNNELSPPLPLYEHNRHYGGSVDICVGSQINMVVGLEDVVLYKRTPFDYLSRPDLQAKKLVLNNNSRIINDDEIQVRFELKNCGESGVNDIRILLYIDEELIQEQVISELLTDESKEITFTIQAKKGMRNVQVVIDPDDDIGEIIETNNEINIAMSVYPKSNYNSMMITTTLLTVISIIMVINILRKTNMEDM